MSAGSVRQFLTLAEPYFVQAPVSVRALELVVFFGVIPGQFIVLSLAVMSAPASRSAITVLLVPKLAAPCSGVRPVSSSASMSTPAPRYRPILLAVAASKNLPVFQSAQSVCAWAIVPTARARPLVAIRRIIASSSQLFDSYLYQRFPHPRNSFPQNIQQPPRILRSLDKKDPPHFLFLAAGFFLSGTFFFVPFLFAWAAINATAASRVKASGS